MLKRFLLGFILGIGLMYYYLHYSEEVATDATHWAEKSASRYRGDKHRRLADEIIKGR